MRSQVSPLCALAVFVLACQGSRRSLDPQRGDATAPFPSVRAPVSVRQPSAESSLKTSPVSSDAAPSARDTLPARSDRTAAIGSARRLVAEKKYPEAVAAYDKILEAAEDADPAVMGELGYLQLTRTGASDAAIHANLWFAAGAAKDPKLAAQIWYNVGLFETRLKRLERARLAYARSLSLNPSTDARKALAGRSACQAIIRFPAERYPVVTGWLGLCRLMERCAENETVDEQSARHRVCGLNPNGSENRRECDDGPPWVFSQDRASYHLSTMMVIPVGENRFFAHATRTGHWPATCDENTECDRERDGDWLVVTTRRTENTMPRAERLQGSGICWPGPTLVTLEFIAVDTGKVAVEITTVDGSGVEVRPDLPDELSVSGGGCDQRIRLARQGP